MQQGAWEPWKPLVSVRPVQTLTQGLGSRFHQVVSPRGAARSRRWQAAAVACAVGDVARAAALRRDDELRLWTRLAGDAADLALWCLAAGDDPDSSEDAVVPGAVLAVEAGARLGPAGLVVPLANAAVAGLVRRHRAHQLRLYQLSWQAMGSLAGWAFKQSNARRCRRLLDAHRAEVAAREQQAELEGLHEVIVENEGALDLLQRATVLIDLSDLGRSRRSDVSGLLKAAVAETVRERTSYLGDALATWQGAHNNRPDLSQLVEICLEPGAGTVVLSPGQGAHLAEQLEMCDLAGKVPVRLVDPAEGRRPFGRRELDVGGRLVVLEAEEALARFRLDGLPAAFLLNLGWLAAPTGPHREAVPWKATAGPVVLGVAAAFWSARAAVRPREDLPALALAASFVITGWYTVSSAKAMRHPHTDAGVSRYPWVMPLQGYELVRVLTAGQLRRGGQVAGLAGTVALVGAGRLLSPRPRSDRALVAELVWPAGFAILAGSLRRAMADSAGELSAASAAEDAAAIETARELGQQRGWAIVRAALEEGRSRLAAALDELDPELSAEAARRLDEVESYTVGRSGA